MQLNRYLALSKEDQQEHREALRWLIQFSLNIHLVKFKKLTRQLQSHTGDISSPNASEPQILDAVRLAKVVIRVSRNLPWTPTCLVQVLALQRMMARRSLPGVFYLGAVTDSDEARAAGRANGLAAHAWLACGEVIICGGQDSPQRFATLAGFTWT